MNVSGAILNNFIYLNKSRIDAKILIFLVACFKLSPTDTSRRKESSTGNSFKPDTAGKVCSFKPSFGTGFVLFFLPLLQSYEAKKLLLAT